MALVLGECVLAPCRTSMRILIRSTSSSEASTVIGCNGGRLMVRSDGKASVSLVTGWVIDFLDRL